MVTQAFETEMYLVWGKSHYSLNEYNYGFDGLIQTGSLLIKGQ